MHVLRELCERDESAVPELRRRTRTPPAHRVDNSGGGWPGTLLNVANAIDHARELATKYPLDLKRVVITGNSAGGDLALWARPWHERLSQL